MQHFAQFSSSDDGAEKESKGSWARDAAIGGLEGGLAIHLTEPLVNRWTGGIAHGTENAVKQTLKQKLLAGGKKTAIAAGVGGLSTLAVGAGLNAVGGLLKKKQPQPDDQYNTQQPAQQPAQQPQAQYSYQGVHFADFAPTPEQLQLAALNKQKLAQVGGDVTHPEYQAHLAKQKQAFDTNRLNTATQGAQAAIQAKQTAAAEAKRVAGLNGLGKARHYGGKALGTAGKLGGVALTASYVLPSLMSLIPQKPQPEQDHPY
jgi:hypothetical protein